uniref:Uncharacterized protein n=1 Tax=Romanomermis culicivorax TaxID=13658 RepID=A0A915L651_ROMCU
MNSKAHITKFDNMKIRKSSALRACRMAIPVKDSPIK